MVKKFFILLFFLMMIVGCGRSSLYYQDRALLLSIDEMRQHLEAKPLHIHHHNYQTLYITQQILTLPNGDTVVLEQTQTDDTFQYEPSTTKSIEIIFETKNIMRVYGENHLNFYQLILQDDSVLNLISQQGDDQELTLLYGLDTPTLNRIISYFDTNAPKAPLKSVIGIKPEKAIYTKWDARKVHIAPLIVPQKYMMGGS